mmetsp:Transcript_66938/g.151245  ORF Transcript_66938/g.151245 Transcript_66938/m.151245 type:complete len:239 (-) Transcript_66938:662-1378(-)
MAPPMASTRPAFSASSSACFRSSRNSRHVTCGETTPWYFSGRLIRSSIPWKGIPSRLRALSHSCMLRSSMKANLPLVRTCMIGFPSPRVKSASPTSVITAPKNSCRSAPDVPSTTLPTKSSRYSLVAGSGKPAPPAAPPARARARALDAGLPAAEAGSAPVLPSRAVSCSQVMVPVFTPRKAEPRSILSMDYMKQCPINTTWLLSKGQGVWTARGYARTQGPKVGTKMLGGGRAFVGI